ncbi:MAG: single-stranded-DNA-specific exonuclease RecJ, partial [Ruminococcus sp.]|nr:single-stranded-DNA-specific exonuclease RecJ [Candidatus Apopatosoma intestinale]
YNRGFLDVDDATEYMEKSDSFLYDPFLLRDMDKAVSVIEDAIENEKKITVYGDYDVDGMTSVSILLRYLHGKNAKADFYIPSRDTEGYGLNCEAMDAIKESGTDLVITVDSGITAVEEVEYAHRIGLSVVVTDHHQCPVILPDADAVINPHRPDCPYPFKDLAGVGVAFKLICALELTMVDFGLYQFKTVKEMCRNYAELVAIGTVADVMPLVGENRFLVYLGLNLMKNTKCLGLRALLKDCGLEIDETSNYVTKQITASNISFSVAPRLNSIGRLGDAGRAVQLFLTPSPILADVISLELHDYNRERKETETAIMAEAEKTVSENPLIADDPVMIIPGNGWHCGVIGIVASRILEKYGKPVVLISFSDDSSDGKGSARSIEGFDIFKAFSACSDSLVRFGGHEMAAGLTVTRDQIDRFRKKMREYCRIHYPDGLPRPTLQIDCEIQNSDIGFDLLDELSLLEPCGAGNPSPLFLLSGIRIEDMISLTQNKHTKLMINGENGERVPVLFFNRNLKEEDYVIGDTVDLVFHLDSNDFRGETTVQLNGEDIRLSACVLEEYRKADDFWRDILTGKTLCPTDDYPSRDDFAALYLSLRRLISGGKTECTMRGLLRLHPSFSYIKLSIMLAVLSDCDLLIMKKTGTGSFRVTLPPTKEKKNLMESPAMLRIRKE